MLRGTLDLELVAQFFGTHLEVIARASRAGVVARVIEVDPASGRLAFGHELVREAVLARLLEPQRRGLPPRLFAAARQLGSRARRRVHGTDATAGTPGDRDRGRRHQVVAAFLDASRNGRFDAMLELLDPEVVLRADDATVQMGSPAVILGASMVAVTFYGRAKAARLALVDGEPGAMWDLDGHARGRKRLVRRGAGPSCS